MTIDHNWSDKVLSTSPLRLMNRIGSIYMLNILSINVACTTKKIIDKDGHEVSQTVHSFLYLLSVSSYQPHLSDIMYADLSVSTNCHSSLEWSTASFFYISWSVVYVPPRYFFVWLDLVFCKTFFHSDAFDPIFFLNKRGFIWWKWPGPDLKKKFLA